MMLSTVVFLPALALSVLCTPIINGSAVVQEAHREQTAVAIMEKRMGAEPDTPRIWSAETREGEEPDAPGIWSVEKRADDEPPAAVKSKQLKRAKTPTPKPWRLGKQA